MQCGFLVAPLSGSWAVSCTWGHRKSERKPVAQLASLFFFFSDLKGSSVRGDVAGRRGALGA